MPTVTAWTATRIIAQPAMIDFVAGLPAAMCQLFF
jgi:hypothetical protein